MKYALYAIISLQVASVLWSWEELNKYFLEKKMNMAAQTFFQFSIQRWR